MGSSGKPRTSLLIFRDICVLTIYYVPGTDLDSGEYNSEVNATLALMEGMWVGKAEKKKNNPR